MHGQSEVADLVQDAEAEVSELVSRTRRGSVSSFRRIRAHLARLPVSEDTFSRLSNMVSDAVQLIATGEFGAACWQLTQLRRKLQRFRADWLSEPVPAVRRTLRSTLARTT